MANGKIVKYKKVYKITIEGKSDTRYPDEPPAKLKTTQNMLMTVVAVTNEMGAWHNVSIEELKK